MKFLLYYRLDMEEFFTTDEHEIEAASFAEAATKAAEHEAAYSITIIELRRTDL